MKSAHQIFSTVKAKLFTSEFIEKHKINAQDFSRRRSLSFIVMFVFILNGIRKSLQVQLNELIDIIDLPHITKQGFSKARKKISASAFIELNEVVVQEFYKDNTFKKYFGYVLLAVDGSTLQLPDSDQIRRKYGVSGNQKERKMPMARITNVYDVLNGINVDFLLEPFKISERECLILHLRNLNRVLKQECGIEKVLLLLDRGFPGYFNFLACVTLGIDFVMRCKIDFLSIIPELIDKGETDVILSDLWVRIGGSQKCLMKKYGFDNAIMENRSFRIIIIDLPTGEKEVLITSLIDQELYPYSEFRELYFGRWGIEENFKFIKVRVEIENFSGKTVTSVEQDAHATILALNLHRLIVNEAQMQLEKERYNTGSSLKYSYKINQNVSMGAFKDDVMEVLLDQESDVKAFCERTRRKIKRSLVPIRPGRKISRERRHNRRKFHMNKRPFL